MNTMTFDGAQFGRDLAAEVRTYLARAIAPLESRIAALEQENTRLKEMIAQRPFTYMGVFKEGATYNLGAFVTFDGGQWHCNQHCTRRLPATVTRPGRWRCARAAMHDD